MPYQQRNEESKVMRIPLGMVLTVENMKENYYKDHKISSVLDLDIPINRIEKSRSYNLSFFISYEEICRISQVILRRKKSAIQSMTMLLKCIYPNIKVTVEDLQETEASAIGNLVKDLNNEEIPF